MTKSFTDIDVEALDALIKRVEDAKENDLALSPEDYQLLLNALVTLANVQGHLDGNQVTIHKLRKLLGIEKASEKSSDVRKNGKGKPSGKKPKNKGKSEKSNEHQVKAEVFHHEMCEHKKGDDCPECDIGKLYKYEPASFLRIRGSSPFTPEQHVMDRLRCNACGEFFTATLAEDVQNDGEYGQKYGYSARSLMGINKFYAGVPYFRQGSVQDLLGVPITASTIFDQTEKLSNSLYFVYLLLSTMAGRAHHYYIDDTTHKILDQKSILKKQRNGTKYRERSGIFCSGMIATVSLHDHDRNIILFKTNIGHSGEFIDEILQGRDKLLPIPLIMSDALSSNKPSRGIFHVQCLCNVHARRQFIDVISHFPDEVDHILESYDKIWAFDGEAKELALTASARLEYHKKHSLPVMEEIKLWCETHLEDKSVEKNSGLGKAMIYFLNHYGGLSQFCVIEGAKLDSNLIEAQLKLVIRDRKNAMFHKTLIGATIGNVITSMIATSASAGINVFHYFNTIQRFHEEAKANPENYLPWNYLETLQNQAVE
jgi:transposase